MQSLRSARIDSKRKPLSLALLWGLAIGVCLCAAAVAQGAPSFSATPLTDMGAQSYLGFSGGLYSNGSNQAPADHAVAGALKAALVRPLDTNGNPSPTGKVVLLSIGMSNTTQEFCAQGNPQPCNSWSFMGQAAADPSVNRTTLAIVNGAQGGKAATFWDSPTDPDYDRVRDTDLLPAGLTEAQVEVAWLKVANISPTRSLPSSTADAYTLETEMGNIVRALKVRYPNLQLVYLSSRTYGGYATTNLNPEPYAYESGFAVKWLIQAQIDQMANSGAIVDARAGDLNYNTVAPWIAWGPYLWADGANPRSDGLTWQPADVRPDDGTHPSTSGQQKVGALLLSFFKAAPTAQSWFPANALPMANFSFAPTSPKVNETVQFTDASTGSPSSWLWNFGDGSVSAAQNPTHAYASPTTFGVTLTVSNASGSNTITKAVTVSAAGAACVVSSTTLCLNNGRFRVATTWQTSTATGSGTSVPLTPDTGYFWFFSSNNVEVVVKVLNACADPMNHYWVFAGGLTNAAVTLTVTDTQSGTAKTYTNPLNTAFRPIQDTAAFATCP